MIDVYMRPMCNQLTADTACGLGLVREITLFRYGTVNVISEVGHIYSLEASFCRHKQKGKLVQPVQLKLAVRVLGKPSLRWNQR